jgi:hypothetical protein
MSKVGGDLPRCTCTASLVGGVARARAVLARRGHLATHPVPYAFSRDGGIVERSVERLVAFPPVMSMIGLDYVPYGL